MTSPVAPRTDAGEWLAGRAPVPDAAALRALNLAAYAYTVLPTGDERREGLRPDYLAGVARHVRVREELLPLVRRWQQAGVDVLLFRGFSLAEFVYPVAGTRAHGAVDVLFRPDDARPALRVAREMGWTVLLDNVSRRSGARHAAFVINSPGGMVQLDAHLLALHCRLPWSAVQRTITRAVWSASRVTAWEGTTVRTMAPVDSALVGLVLERCWGGDRWRAKPSDAVDLLMLRDRAGLTRSELLARADELGCARTLRIFMDRIDPWSGRVSLALPARSDVRAWDRAAFPERGLLGGPEDAVRLLTEVGMLRYAARAVPVLLRVRRELRRQPDMRELLRVLTPVEAPPGGCSEWERWRVARGAAWAVRLLPTNPRGDCLARSLTAYVLLRRAGWPAVFVSGVRREGGAVVGHAWVELDGVPFLEGGEGDVRGRYTVNFRHPDPSEGVPGGASHLQGAAPQHQPHPADALQ